jgi:drug/metabolite transporter (DMT)-like permease
LSSVRVALLTALALLAFAANSLLCRLALRHTAIDPATFTSIRLFAGAVVLWGLASARLNRGVGRQGTGNWPSAFALFAYAAGFSFAYVSLSAGTGALLLFGSVQATMIGYGLWRGERLQATQLLGLVLAAAGIVGLLLPGLSAPPLLGAASMIVAGIAWGIYSLRGRGGGDPTAVTAGNFIRTVPITALLTVLMLNRFHIDVAGTFYAIASGAIASGVGYAIWYTALPQLRATIAATVQLSVPVIAALGGVLLLGEQLTTRLVLASIAILSGIALVILFRRAG